MLTIPNALTALRAIGIPFFIWVGLDGRHDFVALLILAVGGATDYFDGKLARALNQTSRFGELADPAIDRIYIVATLFVLFVRGAIPLVVVALLLARDILLAFQLVAMKRKSIPPHSVTYLGKSATFNLLYAFPFLLLTLHEGALGTFSFVLGWAFAIWGIALYLFTGISYFLSGQKLLASRGN